MSRTSCENFIKIWRPVFSLWVDLYVESMAPMYNEKNLDNGVFICWRILLHTCDNRCAWQKKTEKLAKFRVWDKALEGKLLILEISEFFYNTVQDNPMVASVPKISSIRSPVSTEHRLVTDWRTDSGLQDILRYAYALHTCIRVARQKKTKRVEAPPPVVCPRCDRTITSHVRPRPWIWGKAKKTAVFCTGDLFGGDAVVDR